MRIGWEKRTIQKRMDMFNRHYSGLKAQFREIDKKISKKEGEIKAMQEERSEHFLPSYLELGKIKTLNQYILKKIDVLEDLRWMAENLRNGEAKHISVAQKENLSTKILQFKEQIDNLRKEHARNNREVLVLFGRIQDNLEQMKRRKRAQ